MGGADGGDAHAGAVHRARVELRAQARRHPPAGLQATAATCACSRARATPQDLPAIADAVARAARGRGRSWTARSTWDGTAYHVFDVVWLEGRDLTSLPLEERRALLDGLPLRPPLQRVRTLDDEKPWERACREGWEGVIAKRRGSPYEHRRSPHWLKMKCEATQELVVGGFTDPQGRRVGLGALLVGLLRRRRPRVRRQGRHRARLRRCCGACARGSTPSRSHAPPFTQGQRAPAPARALDAPRGRGAGRASSSGPRTASCAIRACWGCAPTRRPREVVRETP